MSAISICSAVCSNTSLERCKSGLYCSVRDLSSILCKLPRWPPRKNQNLTPKIVSRGVLEGKQGLGSSQFAPACVQTHHLGHVKGDCIIQEGTWPSYFVHYHIDHSGRSKILLSRKCLEVHWKNQYEDISIFSTMCTNASPRTCEKCFLWFRKELGLYILSTTTLTTPEGSKSESKTVSRGALVGRKEWAPSQFALLCAQTHHLGYIKGVCIVEEWTWPQYFVH